MSAANVHKRGVSSLRLMDPAACRAGIMKTAEFWPFGWRQLEDMCRCELPGIWWILQSETRLPSDSSCFQRMKSSKLWPPQRWPDAGGFASRFLLVQLQFWSETLQAADSEIGVLQRIWASKWCPSILVKRWGKCTSTAFHPVMAGMAGGFHQLLGDSSHA